MIEIEMAGNTSAFLKLPDEVIAEMKRHARETYPNECCGALLGDDRKVSLALPTRNATENEPRRRYLIPPEEYLRAERTARETGLRLIGIYHSHPNHPARPSRYDLENAWPNIDYVILAVTDREIEAITAWRLDGSRSHFDEQTIV